MKVKFTIPFWGCIPIAVLALTGLKLGLVERDGSLLLVVFKHSKTDRKQLVFFLFPSPPVKFSTPYVGEIPVAAKEMVTIKSVWHVGTLASVQPWLFAFLRTVFRALPYIYIDEVFRKRGLYFCQVDQSANDDWFPVIWGVGKNDPLTSGWTFKWSQVCFLYSNKVLKVLSPKLLSLSLMVNSGIGLKPILFSTWKLLFQPGNL